jgi:hypothetical protein
VEELFRGELFDGIWAGDIGAVRRFLDAAPGAASSRGPDGVSAVLTARYRGHHEIVEALIRAGCDLDVFDAAALGWLHRFARGGA